MLLYLCPLPCIVPLCLCYIGCVYGVNINYFIVPYNGIINRWPYRLFQKLIDYKSKNRTLYINPEGTSSECPVCGGKLRHPIWKESKCINCGVTFNRDRLSSLSISVRGLYLCGTPFTVSGSSSWHSMKNNYLYHPDHVVIENSSDCKKYVHGNA